ncbi:MAG: SDR family oxidoreductase, partial [Moorea sp. SIO2I5]|nr:SDR family oxidoreductase [Moorena sp. SIO2I5]
SEEAAKQASEEAATHGVKAIALQADVTNPEQAKSLVEQTVEELGGLSVVVNVVGNYLYKLTSKISTEEWHEILDSNLNCTFYITQAALPYLKAAKWGRIVNFATTGAHHVTARENHAIYIIAKTGIIIYTKSIAKELAKDKITANVIAPGVAENSIGLEEVVPRLPMKRPATLQEMNNAVWFFINPEADYITGQVLEVSGGYQL